MGSKGQYLTSQQIIILNFLEHQRKLEQEKLRKHVKRNYTPNLNSIEKQTDPAVLNQGRTFSSESLTLSPGRRQRTDGALWPRTERRADIANGAVFAA